PAGPALASLSMGMAAGLPFLVAGGLKIAYDVALYLTFRRVELVKEDPEPRGMEKDGPSSDRHTLCK
nr:hypothetical protein [Chloroflexota bacterium]